MLRIREYRKVKSLEEAYELNQKKTNRIIGGGLWMKIGDRNLMTAIDLSGLGLDQISETEDEFVIGCMATLRDLEVHPGLNAYTDGAVKQSVCHIVGVQFRNCATVGGSIYGRFGFSDVLTLFAALDCYVELYKGGNVPIQEFIHMNYDNEVLICHGDDIVLSNGAYSGVNKPFKTLEAIGKISDSVYRQKLSLYGCDLDIYVFKTRSNIWSMLMHNAPIIVFLMLINVFFPLCLVSIFNHSFTSRILQLSKVFKSVDSEKLVSMTDRESKDEIGSMIKNYNRMVSRTNDLIQTVYKNKLKEQEMLVSQKNAELLALHSQINPHFLFNALESIRMHSLLKRENETADMVEKLAIMQRQYVEWGNDAVTVAKECEFVKAYLALQKYRFGERLNYNIDIEADCMECQVPKLTLVTFVENACVHGIESKAAPGWIFVRIFKKAGFMHIEVEDTGSGIDPDALEKMKSNMKNADIDMLKNGGRVGVINACLRIKMVTESKAVFDVDSEEGCGTTVMIKIPETYL
jgi:two-component system sensor histidine kinase YesM